MPCPRAGGLVVNDRVVYTKKEGKTRQNTIAGEAAKFTLAGVCRSLCCLANHERACNLACGPAMSAANQRRLVPERVLETGPRIAQHSDGIHLLAVATNRKQSRARTGGSAVSCFQTSTLGNTGCRVHYTILQLFCREYECALQNNAAWPRAEDVGSRVRTGPRPGEPG